MKIKSFKGCKVEYCNDNDKVCQSKIVNNDMDYATLLNGEVCRLCTLEIIEYPKERVYINEFNQHMEYFKKLNSMDLNEIEIYDENNDKINIPDNCIKEFSLTGLGIKDFIDVKMWDQKWIIKL